MRQQYRPIPGSNVTNVPNLQASEGGVPGCVCLVGLGSDLCWGPNSSFIFLNVVALGEIDTTTLPLGGSKVALSSPPPVS